MSSLALGSTAHVNYRKVKPFLCGEIELSVPGSEREGLLLPYSEQAVSSADADSQLESGDTVEQNRAPTPSNHKCAYPLWLAILASSTLGTGIMFGVPFSIYYAETQRGHNSASGCVGCWELTSVNPSIAVTVGVFVHTMTCTLVGSLTVARIHKILADGSSICAILCRPIQSRSFVFSVEIFVCSLLLNVFTPTLVMLAFNPVAVTNAPTAVPSLFPTFSPTNTTFFNGTFAP